MRIERELACDDWVVRGGASPTRYARWLLDLACELKAAHTIERLGVAMASRNGLQTRVQAALDPARKVLLLRNRVVVPREHDPARIEEDGVVVVLRWLGHEPAYVVDDGVLLSADRGDVDELERSESQGIHGIIIA